MEIPELLYRPLWWHRQPWGSNWGYSSFYQPHTWKHMQTKCVHDPRAPCGVSRVFIYQTAVHTHLSNHSYLKLREKLKYPQLEPHAGIRMAQVLGSQVYICLKNINKCGFNNKNYEFCLQQSFYNKSWINSIWILFFKTYFCHLTIISYQEIWKGEPDLSLTTVTLWAWQPFWQSCMGWATVPLDLAWLSLLHVYCRIT